MTTTRIRFGSLAVIAALALAGNVLAQDKPAAVLNSLEVQQLVKRAEPGDSARLAAHYAALGDRYSAEAKRHTSMAQTFVGNPNRSLGMGMSEHCKQLAELDTKSATELRELAAYHQKLASGVAATPPAGGSRFEGGAGAPAPTEQELKAMAMKASTRAEHKALEEYFLTLAKRYRAAASEHVTLAATYRGTKIAQASAIHDHLARLARDSAKEATAAAEMHEQLANIAR